MKLIDACRRLGDEVSTDLRAARTGAARVLIDECYPEQRAMLAGLATAPYAAVQANRRAGKTFALARLIEARLINRDGYVVRVVSHRLGSPSANWLDCADKESLLARLDRLGLRRYAKVQRQARSVVNVKFDWGSEISVIPIGTTGAIDTAHGTSGDLWWCDEAQNATYLSDAVGQLIAPTLADSGAQLILSGTPGRELGGYFHHSATGDDASVVRARVYSWQNPIFGDSPEDRWSRLVEQNIRPHRFRYNLSPDDLDKLLALDEPTRVRLSVGLYADDAQKKWFTSLEPDFRRQHFGAWVTGGAEYVFHWPRDAETDDDDADCYWLRDATSPWKTCGRVAADTITGRVAQLPTRRILGQDRALSWTAVVGCDLGWNPSSTSIVVVVYSHDYGRVLVLWSESAFEQPDHETLERLMAVVSELRQAGVGVSRVIADVNGTRKGTGASWDHSFRQRFGGQKGHWISEAAKADKDMQLRQANLDLGARRWQFVEGDSLDVEGRYLRWKAFDPAKPKAPKIDKFREVVLPDGRALRPGDHCLDAWRYLFPLIPLLNAEPENDETEQQRRYRLITEQELRR